ncbi:hypothetical protein ISCGN_032009 [Ixodes scapularis]
MRAFKSRRLASSAGWLRSVVTMLRTICWNSFAGARKADSRRQGIKENAGNDHFEPSQFQARCSDGWRRLKATAVPSLFLHSKSQQPAARTPGAALQGGLLTQPLPTTSRACFVTSDNQRGQASVAARGTLVSAASTSWQPAARTPGAALQGGLLTQPLPTTSGACFVTSDNQRGQASVAARGTLVSAASTSWQPAARTPGAALQGGLLTQPLPTTSRACFVTSDNQRGQASVAARGTLVSAASTSWQPAARTPGAALQGGLLTQPLPTTSGACFVTSDNQRGQASVAARGTLVSAASTSWQPAAKTPGAALQGGLLTQPLPTTSRACFVSIFQGPAYPRVAIPPHSLPQVTSDNQRGQASVAARGTLVSAASTSWQPAARTPGAALQGGLLTQPLPTTSGACFVSIFQGPAYPRVAIPPHSLPQVTSDNQRGQASIAARGTLVSAASTSWQPAAKTPGAALQGGLLTQPLPTTSRACFVSIFQGPAYPRVSIPPHSLPQVTSDNQHGQASVAACGTLVSAVPTSWQPAAGSSEQTLQPLSPSPVPPRLTEDVFLQMSRKIKQLENENRRLVRQAALQKTREATFRSQLHKIFTADQLAALSRSSNRGSKWSNETVKKSLQMRFACGSTGYDLLLEGGFPLPSSRTLRRRLEGEFVFRLLKCFKAPC